MPLITSALTALSTLAATTTTATAAATTASLAGTGGAIAAGVPTAGLAAGAAGSFAGAGATAAATTGAAATAGGISLGSAGIGSVLSGVGTVASAGFQYQAGQEQRAQESLRKKQMQLESDRARREVIRKTQITQAVGLNNAAQAGGELATSSAYGGIIGQNVGNAGFETTSIRQNEEIGGALFASNARESQFNSQASLFGAGANFGKMLVDNNAPIGRIGATLFGRT